MCHHNIWNKLISIEINLFMIIYIDAMKILFFWLSDISISYFT